MPTCRDFCMIFKGDRSRIHLRWYGRKYFRSSFIEFSLRVRIGSDWFGLVRFGSDGLKQFQFRFGRTEGLIADAGSLGWGFLFGNFRSSFLLVIAMQITFDAAFGEADHGIDEAC